MVNTLPSGRHESAPPCISIGILAWNEEEAMRPALASLFRQSLFPRLAERGLRCEILFIANGCTDRTPAIASEIFEEQSCVHLCKAVFSCRTIDLPHPGKNNAWNLFVHSLSLKQAEVLFLMDADIVLHHPDTLWNMYQALIEHPNASIATDTPLKDLSLLPHPTIREKLSLATSHMTQRGTAQLSGQLYCIRAAVARNIYLPHDLAACEDGFIKALACTCFQTQVLCSERIVRAPNASHIFEAYTKAADIFRNQKRQIIGQTIVHILVDQYLKRLPVDERLHLAETLRLQEKVDPDWLKKLIAAHLRRVRFFWRLFPGLFTFRFHRLARLKGSNRIAHFPAAVAGFLIALPTAWQSWRFLRRGSTQYWPDTRSQRLRELPTRERQIGTERGLSILP